MEYNLVIVTFKGDVVDSHLFIETDAMDAETTSEKATAKYSEKATAKYLELCEKFFPDNWEREAEYMADNLSYSSNGCSVSLVVPKSVNGDYLL